MKVGILTERKSNDKYISIDCLIDYLNKEEQNYLDIVDVQAYIITLRNAIKKLKES